MAAIYNEIEPFACAWLEALIGSGAITDGTVERRSIADLGADELRGHSRAHFFAGIGGWDHALELAGWPADWPVWTGSCPCQPFSAAGKGLGDKDPRHLWPEFRRLIALCRPPVVFGEQVASKAGRLWLAGVRADMEALGYAVGAADLCAAGVGAPHIRQRLYWVAYAVGGRFQIRAEQHGEQAERAADRSACGRHADGCGDARGMADAESIGLARGQAARGRRSGSAHDGRLVHPAGNRREQRGAESGRRGTVARRCDCGMGHADRAGREEQRGAVAVGSQQPRAERPGAWGGVYLDCTDGKARRVEPGVCPLAHGVPGRVGQLRGYGNAIVPQVAAQFVSAFMEAINLEVGNA